MSGLVFTGLGCCWLATGRVSAQLPPHCCCCWAQLSHHTNTHQTFREYTQTKLDICTLNFTYRFALIYSQIFSSYARPLSPLQQGVCPRLLRMRRSRVCRAQAPAPGGDMPMSAETELDCLVTTSRGHVPGHVTCPGHVILIMITMGLQLHFAWCH